MIRFVRARSRLVSSLAMPFFWMVLIGVGFSSSFSLPGMNYMTFMAPGIVGMVVFFASVMSGVSVIWDRQFGFLKEILVAPVSRTSIVLGKTLGGATVACISGMLMLLVASLLGAIVPSIGILAAVVFMVLIATSFVAVGLIIASRMRSMEGFQMIMSFVMMPIFFLSGALFPLQNTPQWMQTIASFNPLTYGVDGLRDALVGAGMFPMWIDFAALVITSAILVLIGGYLFRKSTI
jgi:ABC-2 type transport system permease protein